MFAWLRTLLTRMFCYPLPDENPSDHINAYYGRQTYVIAQPDNRR